MTLPSCDGFKSILKVWSISSYIYILLKDQTLAAASAICKYRLAVLMKVLYLAFIHFLFFSDAGSTIRPSPLRQFDVSGPLCYIKFEAVEPASPNNAAYCVSITTSFVYFSHRRLLRLLEFQGSAHSSTQLQTSDLEISTPFTSSDESIGSLRVITRCH